MSVRNNSGFCFAQWTHAIRLLHFSGLPEAALPPVQYELTARSMVNASIADCREARRLFGAVKWDGGRWALFCWLPAWWVPQPSDLIKLPMLSALPTALSTSTNTALQRLEAASLCILRLFTAPLHVMPLRQAGQGQGLSIQMGNLRTETGL